ncbi:hypothetical protein [Mesorhizobium hawassense]|uniref:hypothetical protein n=1 Tax=Mesorhizobium hawassense TaxID=1209954 RepID=UPI00142D5BB3|nr:hypothetical protein [Mesorhizobium hawassense]
MSFSIAPRADVLAEHFTASAISTASGAKLPMPMRQAHDAGRRPFVDNAGDIVAGGVDRRTNKTRPEDSFRAAGCPEPVLAEPAFCSPHWIKEKHS